MVPSISYKNKKELHWHTLLLGIFVSSAFFIPFIIYGQGYFLFYGDFNVQQVPFYQLAHEAIKSGEIGWNWDTDLGVNFIGSYSFYLLGSPFFLITLLFPNWMLPYLMGPLLILKFGFAAFTAYFYIRRFVRNPESAMLGSLLYAFCGFSVYNIFFNHFHEAIIVFPILLYSIELHITERRRGIFALAVFFAAITNYFFFYGMVVFCVIYWFIRTTHRCWKQKFRSFLLFVLEAVLGLLGAAVLLCPTILSVLQNDRLSNVNLGYNSWLYGRPQIYTNIIQIFFFPPDIPARPVFFPGADIEWSSMGAWLPLMSMVGVGAYVTHKKKSWIRRLLFTCGFMALVPILNSAFYMFNSAYYARWYYMPILIMCLSTVMALEDPNIDWKPSYKWVLGITVVTSLIIGLWPDGKDAEGNITHLGIYTYEESDGNITYILRYWGACAIAIGSLVILGVILKKYRKYARQFAKSAISAVCVISVIYSAVFLGCGSAHSYDIHNEVIPELIEGELELEGDPDTFRIDCYECMDNTAMFLDYSGINAFHSIVPGSVTEFYEYIGEERSVASRPTTSSAAIRPLLSVKYLLLREDGESFTDEQGVEIMPGYKFLKQENGFNVYENTCYIPYGFTYDYYISKADCDDVSESSRDEIMLKALVLEDEQIKKYSGILSNIADEGYSLGNESFFNDCENRRDSACNSFERTKNGFKAKIDLERENLVFFSVPFEDGWTAYVNGEKAEIENVNIGFMAVLGNEGENEIEFRYETPGLLIGAIISLMALVLFAAYLTLVKIYRKFHPVVYMGEWPEGEELIKYYKKNPLKEYIPPEKKKPANEKKTEEVAPLVEPQISDETKIDIDAIKRFIGEKDDAE